nr:6-carboxytetrahydropterin synthase [Propionibacterium sp.]
MYRLTVRDHVLCAHSIADPAFGPAQRLHGVTYVVEATWVAERLDDHHVVTDIGAATARLKEVLAPLDYANLDELPEFAGVVTTTEVLCRWVAERLAPDAPANVTAVEVTLREHPDAWASYTLALAGR